MSARLILFSLVLTTAAFQANAKDDASIRTPRGNMVKTSHDRVNGRLSDLKNDDDDSPIICYAGDPDEVCAIVKAAVREENDKENLKGDHAWDVRKCDFRDDGKGAWPLPGGYVTYSVTRKTEAGTKGFIGGQMPKCSAIKKP